jgi:predicted dehydrogenase
MRIAFIGASHWHLPLYLEPLLDYPGVEIVGVSDPAPARTAALAAKLNCPGDADFRALCRRVRPDFVFALGRHIDMPEQAEFLIAEGIPFALEKPCGLDELQVARIARAAAAKGAFAAVPLVFRHGDFHDRLRAMSRDGGIQYMSYRFIAGFPERYRQAGCDWMLEKRLAGGGCTINLAVHFLDLCVTLMGDGVAVTRAQIASKAWGHEVEDYSALTLETPDGLCTVETGYLYPAPTSNFDLHYAVRSPKQYLVAHDDRSVEVVELDGRREMIASLTTNVPHYRSFVFDVLDRVKAGKPPLASLDDMVPVMRLVDQCYAKAGQ